MTGARPKLIIGLALSLTAAALLTGCGRQVGSYGSADGNNSLHWRTVKSDGNVAVYCDEDTHHLVYTNAGSVQPDPGSTC